MQDHHVTWLVSLQLKDLATGPPFWKQLTGDLSPAPFPTLSRVIPKWGTWRERARARVKNSTNVMKKYNCHTWCSTLQTVCLTVYTRTNREQTESVFWKKKVWNRETYLQQVSLHIYASMVCQCFFSLDVLFVCGKIFARLSRSQTHCDSFCSYFWLRGNWIGSEISTKQEHGNSE